MQTTVKHAPRSFVVYVGFGDRALEAGLFPFRWVLHSKRTQFSRKKKAAEQQPCPPVLPGFTEPEHPPQTNTVFSK